MPDDKTPDLMFPGEVAALFRVDPKTVTRWGNNGKLPPGTVIRTPGGHRRYRRAGVMFALRNGERS